MERVSHPLLPSRAMLLLLGIGFLDLVVTAVLHAQGQIVELNPLMRPIIEQSEWLFAFVKGGTLVIAWYVMAKFGATHRLFIRNACLGGSGIYVMTWCIWFMSAK